MYFVKAASAILLAFVVGACVVAPGPVSGRPTETASQQVSLATASQSEVEACRAESEIASSLEGFARAVNNGDRVEVEKVVSSAAQWFSLTTSEGHEVAYGHNNIVEHLIAMQVAGDRFVTVPTPNQLTLVAWDGAGHFGLAPFTFERGGKRIELSGKGALYCGGRARGVEVLSLGSG
jgi:hypothetical protein